MPTKKDIARQLYTDNWPRRRKWMITVLLWALANAQYLIVWGHDSGLSQNALVALLGLIAAIIGSYVFGAVWDDNDKRRRFGFGHRHFDDDDYDAAADPLDVSTPSTGLTPQLDKEGAQ